MQGFIAIHRVGIDRLGVEDRLADVTERLVHGMSERVNCGRLMVAWNDKAGAMVLRKIVGSDFRESRLLGWKSGKDAPRRKIRTAWRNC